MDFLKNKGVLKKIFIGVSVCILLYWVLNAPEQVQALYDFISAMLSPFVVGASIAFILNVPMRGIERMLRGIKNAKLRRGLSICLASILVVIIIVVVFLLLIPQLIETTVSVYPKIVDFFLGLETQINAFLAENPQFMEWIVANTGGGASLQLDWASIVQNVLSVIGNSLVSILLKAYSAVGSVASALMNLVISLVFAVYALFQKELLAKQGKKLLYAFFPEKFSDGVVRVLRLSNSVFSNFISGQCIEVCILGCMFAVSMAIFGMPYIALISVLIAVTAFIPVVGAWIGCIVGAFLILLTDPLMAVWFVIMFLILQQIENNMIYPKVVGTSIGLNGMWVLVAIGIGDALMGVGGMVLMIPVVSVLYTLLAEATAQRLALRNVPQEKLENLPTDEIQPRNKWKDKLSGKKLKQMKSSK